MGENLHSPLGIFFLVVFGTESVISLLGNGFVIVVMGQSWLLSRKMAPCDFLLTILSLSRILLQSVIVGNRFVYFSTPETYIHSTKQRAFAFIWVYLNIASIWCVMGLNVYYCVKVANFAHPLFVWLKPRIGVLVPRFLGISFLAFIIFSVPVIMNNVERKCHNLTGTLPGNTSQSDACSSNLSITVLSPFQFFFNTVSFGICMSSSILLLLSLWRHRRNLKKSGLGSKDVSTQVHLKVIKQLFFLLFFYVIHYIAIVISVGDIFKYDKLESLISDIVLCSYPSVHPVILIFTNPKLKKGYIYILNLRRRTS